MEICSSVETQWVEAELFLSQGALIKHFPCDLLQWSCLWCLVGLWDESGGRIFAELLWTGSFPHRGCFYTHKNKLGSRGGNVNKPLNFREEQILLFPHLSISFWFTQGFKERKCGQKLSLISGVSWHFHCEAQSWKGSGCDVVSSFERG